MTRNAWMRVLICVVAASLMVGCATVAFGQPDPNQFVDRQVTAMKERLKLTDDQEKKVRPILLDSMKQMMAMREKYNLQPGQAPSEEAMAAMKKSREETTKKLSEVLNKDQMAEYEKMLAERRGGPGGGGRKKQ